MPRQTSLAKPGQFEPRWHHVNAEGKVLGRMATRIASVLMGKHHPRYTPHVDTGDFVVVTNAEKVVLTGNKLKHKQMISYVYYPGGQKRRSYESVMQRHPERIIEFAVSRMLPKNKLGRHMAKKLKVYRGPEHPHQAQQPAELKA